MDYQNHVTQVDAYKKVALIFEFFRRILFSFERVVHDH